MRLRDILSGCQCEGMQNSVCGIQEGVLSRDAEISGIAYDSRKVLKDNLFVAIKGENFDGHDFINDAVKRGAAAIVCEREVSSLPGSGSESQDAEACRLLVRVRDSRKALACIAGNFYGRPSEAVTLIGITGTNGKTTTSYIVRSILRAWGRDTGLIGTINCLIKDRELRAEHTTPEAPEFQKLLADMSREGCSHVVTEVSSHSLSQRRVDYAEFDIAVFTNLTRDHLDYHGGMEDYYKAKKRLFSELLSENGTAVVYADDAWGRRLSHEFSEENPDPDSGCKLITYGIGSASDIMALDIKNSLSGISFDLRYKDMKFRVNSPLLGIANVYNMLAAAGAAFALDIPADVIKKGLRDMLPVKGRFERIDEGQEFLCIVDYAHTPDALERLILTAREILSQTPDSVGRIITVFGCGGNRDNGKRPLMGSIAARLSDHVIVTSDNPRMEDPARIIEDITAGIDAGNYAVVPDRREALSVAINEARPGDIVLIAGKGHEDYQEIKAVRHKFSDRKTARDAIRNRIAISGKGSSGCSIRDGGDMLRTAACKP